MEKYQNELVNITIRRLTDHQSEINSIKATLKFVLTIVAAYMQWLNTQRALAVRYETKFNDFLSAIDALANGRMSTTILTPPDLKRYLDTINADLYASNPDWELVFHLLHMFYAEPLVTFTNTPDYLLLQIPVFVL